MSNDKIAAILKKSTPPGKPVAKAATEETLTFGSPAEKEEEPAGMPAVPEADDWTAETVVGRVTAVEVEAVIGGVLQRVRLGRCNPAEVGLMLRALDPGAKWRDDWPKKSFGDRPLKTARVLVISLRVSDSGKFWDLVGRDEDDLSIGVSKKNADTMLDLIRALNRVGEKHLAKLQAAMDGKASATIVLSEAEQFGARYWTTDEGKHYLDSLEPEPPAAATEPGEGASDG